jgi:hypothetical protein
MTRSTEVLESTQDAESVDLKNVRPGSLIDVETTNRHYRIECLGGEEIRISGHPRYCPQPVPAHLQGSVDYRGAVESGFIEPGMRMQLVLNDDHPIRTSKIVSVHVDPPAVAEPS